MTGPTVRTAAVSGAGVRFFSRVSRSLPTANAEARAVLKACDDASRRDFSDASLDFVEGLGTLRQKNRKFALGAESVSSWTGRRRRHGRKQRKGWASQAATPSGVPRHGMAYGALDLPDNN